MIVPEVRVPERYPSAEDLRGKVVAVTGAGRGLGHVIADAMAAHGADVAVCGRTRADLEKAGSRITGRGRRALMHVCDVRSVEQLRAFMGAVEEEFGRLDVLVNNAGGGTRTIPDQLTEEEWDQVADTNLKGVFFASQIAARLMRRHGGGSIINIASVLGVVGHPRFAAYATTKGGVIQMTRTLAVAWAPAIRVNAVAPGYIASPLNAYRKGNPQLEAEVFDHTPMRRFGQVEDVAMACVFLASDATPFITGHTLFVDGGLSIT
jgi:NAD(P)-dependent dehydrogenase (short-subunit alcohol dehydrogenase family)